MNTLSIYQCLAFFAGSFLLSLLLTPLVKRVAHATGQVAVPRDNRWHKKPTALMGGAGIFVSFVAVWGIGVYLMGWPVFGIPCLTMILCASGIFLLGLIDDIFNMTPQHKLAGQIVIASVLILFGFRLEWSSSLTADLFLSILWVVGITNAFNLLDNMDGLSAGVAFISGLFLFLMHYLAPVSILSGSILLISSIYLGVILGFLIYNFNPASIFMGDSGSLFIGFLLAGLTMMSSSGPVSSGSSKYLLSVIAIPILILFIPILDTGFVSLMRKLFNRPISQGGRDHSSHRMVAIGFSEKKAVLILYLFSLVSGLIALAIGRLGIGTSLVIIVFYLLLVVFFWIYLAKVKVYPEESILSENGARLLTPILIDITYRRRLFEVFLDLILIAAAYYTAHLLRFEGRLLGNDFSRFITSLPIIIACQMLWFFIAGIYRGVWSNVGIRDLITYFKAVTAGAMMAMLIIVFVYRFEMFSRAVFVIYWFLMIILISLSRLSFRLMDEGIRKQNQKGIPTIIYGAGVGGQVTMKEIEANRDLGLMLVGFLDDNLRLHNRKIYGYPVLGGQEELKEIVARHGIKKIIVSFKENSSEKKKLIENICFKSDIEMDVSRMRLIID